MARMLFLFCLIIATGCGSKVTSVYPVSGKVLLGEKAVANATVVFHPIDPAERSPRFRATTGADGTFVIASVEGQNGAPEGAYRVTVEQWLAGTRNDDGPSNRLPAKYAKPESSGLSATVVAGSNQLSPFVLKK